MYLYRIKIFSFFPSSRFSNRALLPLGWRCYNPGDVDAIYSDPSHHSDCHCWRGKRVLPLLLMFD